VILAGRSLKDAAADRLQLCVTLPPGWIPPDQPTALAANSNAGLPASSPLKIGSEAS
jgi:hypothetical protein